MTTARAAAAARRELTRALAAATDADTATMGGAGRALVRVHALRQTIVSATARLPRPAARQAYYPPGESTVLRADDLERLSPTAARVVATVLWWADFKWLTGTPATGMGTHAHFGYGARPISVRELAAFRLRGRLLFARVGDQDAAFRLTSIEAPLRPDRHIFVRGRRVPLPPARSAVS